MYGLSIHKEKMGDWQIVHDRDKSLRVLALQKQAIKGWRWAVGVALARVGQGWPFAPIRFRLSRKYLVLRLFPTTVVEFLKADGQDQTLSPECDPSPTDKAS